MAGLGSRFTEAGYIDPKPMIDINGKPMIQRVIESLNIDAQYIFVVQHDHLKKYNLVSFLNSIVNEPIIVEINEVTDGAARTTLLAKEFINNDSPLIIANSDQIISWNSNEFLSLLVSGNPIALFKANDKKWSYAQIDGNKISRVVEKEVISDNASVGIYGWSKGSDYVKYAEQMISKGIKTNNEFYICPVYNEAILDNKAVIPYFVKEMYGVGTPEDLASYLLKK